MNRFCEALHDPVFTFLLGMIAGVIVGAIAMKIQIWAKQNTQ